MKLYVTVNTNAVKGIIGFISVKTVKGKEIVMDWDESNIDFTDTGFNACYRSVYFNGEYANGCLKELIGAVLTNIQICICEDITLELSDLDFAFTSINVEDGHSHYTFPLENCHSTIQMD